jgi:HK97 gp10 family phage protein
MARRRRSSRGNVNASAVIRGERELMGRLNTMATDLKKDISHDALMEGAKIVQRAASAKAPGEVAQHIEIEIDTTTEVPKATVGPHKDYWQGIFVEFGVRRHVISAKNKTVLSNGSVVFGKEVNHPGVEKRPFMRPAIDEHEDEVKRKIGEVIARRLGAR